MILEQLTYNSFGYHSTDLKLQSNKKIIVSCDECGLLRILQKYNYRDICHKCAVSKNKYWLGKHLSEDTRKKLSECNRGENNPNWGRTRSEETRRKISEGHKGKPHPWACGENNWNWKGGVTSEMRLLKSSPKWKEWREVIFERDNYTCQLCGIKGIELHPHHIRSKAKYPELIFDVDNGTTLCKDCHMELHGLNIK